MNGKKAKLFRKIAKFHPKEKQTFEKKVTPIKAGKLVGTLVTEIHPDNFILYKKMKRSYKNATSS